MQSKSGFILLDKKEGVSSHGALTPLKKLLPKKTKVGHTGTLDPNATGLLPVAIGRASKFIQYLGDYPKKYRAGLVFGIKTDSGDIWGNEIKRVDTVLNLNEKEKEKIDFLHAFRDAIPSFIGEIDQVPPMYSAIKKDGKALYKYARKGIEVDRKSRKVHIMNIDILSFDYPNMMVEVTCSKGTYIRTLIEDIAESMGSIACMTSLIRLSSDGFDLKDAHPIDVFKTEKDIVNRMIRIESLFTNLPSVRVDEKHKKHIKNGVRVDLNRFYDGKDGSSLGMYTIRDYEDTIFALAERTEDSFKTLIVM